MSKEELFKKHSINESHNVWDTGIDSWMGVEIYREMHEGKLPNDNDDNSSLYILKFKEKCDSDGKYFFGLKNSGSMYLTAKRMIYMQADKIIEELQS